MDARKYLGIPFQDKGCGFEGCDCYGLVRLVYREELGIELPCLGDAYSTAYARGEVNNTVQHVSAADWNMDVLGGPYSMLTFSAQWRPLNGLPLRLTHSGCPSRHSEKARPKFSVGTACSHSTLVARFSWAAAVKPAGSVTRF